MNPRWIRIVVFVLVFTLLISTVLTSTFFIFG